MSISALSSKNHRSPFIDIPPADAVSNETSEIVGAVAQHFAESFEQDLFDVNKYRHPELYVPNRTASLKDFFSRSASTPPVASIVENGKPLEKQLYQCFWDKPAYPNPIVFLVGNVGCGKSTALKHFFVKTCPEHPDTPPEEFLRKCVIYIDLCDKPHRELKAFLYAQLRDGINSFLRRKPATCLLSPLPGSACQQKLNPVDILSDDNFLFLQPKISLDTPTFANFSFQQKCEYAQAFAANCKDEEWVDLALKYLTAKRQKGLSPDFPLKYLVLILDNVDQAGYEVLRECIVTIRTWLSLDQPFWKIFIPVWPSIWAKLFRDFNPLPPYHVLPVTMVEPKALIETRSGRLVDKLKPLAVEIDIKNGSSEGKIKLTFSDVTHYFRDGFPEASRKTEFYRTLTNLAGNSTSRLLEFWRGALASPSLQNFFCRPCDAKRAPTYKEVGVYGWCDALITGAYRCHNRHMSRIPNIFYLNDTVSTFHECLVGYHVLHTINSRCLTHASDIIQLLMPFGHSETLLRKTLDCFERYEVFQWIGDNKEAFVLFPGRDVACLQLIEMEAYVDNIAMTTPCEETFLNEMTQTVASDNSQFVQRVKTTLAFLRQIRCDERRFVQHVMLCEPNGTALCEKMADLRIPSAFKRMATVVQNRLRLLAKKQLEQIEQDAPTIILPNVKPGDWAKLRNDPTLQEVEALPTWLGTKHYAGVS